MFKRWISGLVAAALALSAALPAAAAASAGSVGQARADGKYALQFRSDGSGTDLSHEFYYSESFFDHPSTQYDHKLATATLGLTMAAFSTLASDVHYWEDGSVGREDHIAAAFDTLGFGNARFYNYDINLNTAEDYAAYSIAQKTTMRAGKRRTVIAVVLRGGGYGSEWASNVTLGTGAEHEGFAAAAAEVTRSLEEYLTAAQKAGELGEVKLWIGGYSRGAAVANLLAAAVDRELPQIARENVYVYTFAAPAVMTADAPDTEKLDYNNNYNADGTLKTAWDESNIFNLIGSGDLVPQVPPANWGYHRNGNDRYLPMTANSREIQELNALLLTVNPGLDSLDFAKLGTYTEVNNLIESMEKVFTTKQLYCADYQQAVADMLECAFQRTPEEVLEGKVLDNEAIFQRVRGLHGARNFTWDTIAASVLLASRSSRLVLNRIGGNVPLAVQQAVTPLVATGLCYGIELDVVQLMAQYVVAAISARSAPAKSVNVFRCHYPEVYLTLMEYYSPTAHKLEATTRS